MQNKSTVVATWALAAPIICFQIAESVRVAFLEAGIFRLQAIMYGLWLAPVLAFALPLLPFAKSRAGLLGICLGGFLQYFLITNLRGPLLYAGTFDWYNEPSTPWFVPFLVSLAVLIIVYSFALRLRQHSKMLPGWIPVAAVAMLGALNFLQSGVPSSSMFPPTRHFGLIAVSIGFSVLLFLAWREVLD